MPGTQSAGPHAVQPHLLTITLLHQLSHEVLLVGADMSAVHAGTGFPDLVAQDGCMHCFVSLQLGSFFNPSRCHLVGELAPEC